MCCNITAIDSIFKSYSSFLLFRQITFRKMFPALTVLTVTPVLLRSSEEDLSYRRLLRKTEVTVKTVEACNVFL